MPCPWQTLPENFRITMLDDSEGRSAKSMSCTMKYSASTYKHRVKVFALNSMVSEVDNKRILSQPARSYVYRGMVGKGFSGTGKPTFVSKLKQYLLGILLR